MVEIKFNTAEMDEVFAELSNRLTDMTPVMQDIGELMIESTRQNFRAGTSPDGVPWAPKSDATLAAYEASDDTVSTSPLIGPSKSLSTTIFHQATSDAVSWGSNLVYARVMQDGADAGEFGATIGTDKNGNEFFVSTPWGDIPARPFIGVGADDQAAIIETVSEYLDEVDDG